MDRIYYHLTDIGNTELKQMIIDYQTLIDATQNILNYTYDIAEKTC